MTNDAIPSTPTAPVPNTPTPASAAPPPTFDEFDQLTPAQTETMIGWTKQGLAAGKISQAQAEKTFEELGATAEQRAPDMRTDEQKQLDAAFPSANPQAYVLDWSEPGAPMALTSQQLKEADGDVRAGLSAMGFSPEAGSSLFATAKRAAAQLVRLSPEQRPAYWEIERGKLERLHGGTEQLREKLAVANRMIDAVASPRMKDVIGRVGINAQVINMLINHAPVFWAKRGR